MKCKELEHSDKNLQEEQKSYRMKNRIGILLTVICVLGMGVHAQEKMLTKEDAVALALENNYGINVANNQIGVTKNNKSVLNSGYLPTLTGTANANYNRDDSVIEFPGQFNDYGSPRGDLEIEQAEAQRYTSALNANYNLFDGLGRFYNYKSLKEQYQLIELQVRETIENTLLQFFSVEL